jgi:alanine racemase
MDMTMVDVTDVPGVHIGQEAILIGQQGQERHHRSRSRRMAADRSV